MSSGASGSSFTSSALLALARDPKRLGAELGVTMVLHTWTRELLFHPHVHAIVTGGGLSDDDARWVRTRKNFLFPVRVMGALFRGKMLAALERAHAQGHIDLRNVDLRPLRRKPWIVYAKRPFGGPEQVVRYLGRYTHRVPISNQRLVSMDERGVTFRTKDGRSVTLAGAELLARFVEHVLPPRFVKIRHYGLHASANATTRLERARALLPPLVVRPRYDDHDWRDLLLRLTGTDVRVCPCCSKRLSCAMRFPSRAPHRRLPDHARSLDLVPPHDAVMDSSTQRRPARNDSRRSARWAPTRPVWRASAAVQLLHRSCRTTPRRRCRASAPFKHRLRDRVLRLGHRHRLDRAPAIYWLCGKSVFRTA